MEWHINDMSITGQFASSYEFKEILEPLLQFRLSEPELRDRLYCSRALATRLVTPTANIQQAVLATQDKSFIQLTLGWLGKSGRFWDDNRQLNENDYFEYQGQDVTDQGLGEAARRKLVDIDANVFSFLGSSHNFETSPLSVQHGITEEVLGYLDLDNYWNLTSLKNSINSLRTLNSWQDVQVEISLRFGHLILPSEAIAPLLPTPFSRCVASRILELLNVLDRLVVETDENGELSKLGHEILSNHFTGGKPWFSDESDGNKSSFKTEMTFPDPVNTDENIFCSWHGKIKTPQTRIHFQWPRPSKQREIKVLYVGPKITKK